MDNGLDVVVLVQGCGDVASGEACSATASATRMGKPWL